MSEAPLTALNFRISSIAGDALADGLVMSGVTQSVDATRVVLAWIFALTCIYVTETIVGAFVVTGTAGCSRIFRFTVAILGKAVSMFDGTYATTTFVKVHATFECTSTMAGLVNAETLIDGAWNTIIVEIKGISGLAHTFTVLVANEALVDTTERFCEANMKK